MFNVIIPHQRSFWCLFLVVCLSVCLSCSHRSNCSLNLSNAPEVRGLKLGMTLDEFKDHFSTVGNGGGGQPSSIDLTPDENGAIAIPTETTTISEGGRVYSLQRDTTQIGQLLFVNGRVAHFRVVYLDNVDKVNWEDVDQFTKKTSVSLGLPTLWKSKPELQLKENREFLEAWHDLSLSATQSYEHYWHPAARNEAERFLLCGDILISAGVPSPGKRHWTNGAFIQFDDLAALRKLKAQIEERQSEEELDEGKKREGFKP